MPILSNGVFTFDIETKDLARGLRPSRRMPRDSKFLVTCKGAVGYDGVLQVLDDISTKRLNTAVISDGFPYPQIFVCEQVTIVCSATKIYEYSGSLSEKLTVTAGIEWSLVDFGPFIYMTNGKVAVTRHAEDGSWQLEPTLPIASAVCNFNGQVLIGAPGVARS